MTVELITSIGTTFVLVLGVAIPGIISIIRAIHENTKITQETKDKTIEIEHKTDKIHDLTNNNYSELKKELSVSNTEIQFLKKQTEQLLSIIGIIRRDEDNKNVPLINIEKNTKDTVKTLKEIQDK